MRRVVLLVLGVGVLVAMALPAVAKRPECTPDATYPWCDGTTTTTSSTTTTTTTTTPVPDELEVCSDIMVISGKGNTGFECLWTPDRGSSSEPPAVATVTVSQLEGGVNGPPTIFVRDDSPGDICLLTSMEGFEWQVGEGPEGPTYTAEFDLVYDADPDETWPAGYDAWLGHSYWDFEYADAPTDAVVGAYWCAPQDPVLDSLRLDANGTPLHFFAGFNARGGGSMTITLSPGQSHG